MTKAIYFDMDGTIANLYAVDDWLPKLRAYDATPYADAKVMHNMSALAKVIHKAQSKGIKVGIISWLSKEPSESYDRAVAKAKRKWLKKHLKSVNFDFIHIVPYGTPKSELAVKGSILFDDEERNRIEWSKGYAYPPEMIFEILKSIS